jgi:hypothetical protein
MGRFLDEKIDMLIERAAFLLRRVCSADAGDGDRLGNEVKSGKKDDTVLLM